MDIRINPPALDGQETSLSSDVAAAATSSTVENNKSFANNDYVVFGLPGEELTEIVKLTGVSGTTTISHSTGPVFAHTARTPISQIMYNQVKIYSATSETGSYSLLDTVDLTLDQDYTIYRDTAGTESTWYKIKYYNATTLALSSFSSVVKGTGYTDESLASMTDEVLEEFGDLGSKEISRDRVKNLLKAAVRKVILEVIKVYSEYRKQYTTATHTSGTALYDLPTRFLDFVRVDVNYTGSGATAAYKVETFESEAEGQPDTSYQTFDPHVFIRGDQYGLRPTPTSNSGTTFIWYWDYPAVMVNESDVHGMPFGIREILINYALFRLWLPKDKDTAAIYRQEYRGLLPDYIEFVAQGRQAYLPKYVHVTFGEDLYD